MTVSALASGIIASAPVSRTTAAGKPWVTFSLRAMNGNGPMFVSVAVFEADLVAAVLALRAGDAVSVVGRCEVRAWTGRDGVERQGLSITASGLVSLAARARAPRRKAARRAEVATATPFPPEAGDLGPLSLGSS